MTSLFDFLNPHRCPTGVKVLDAALSRRDEKVARLYEQGASKKRIARYLVRWLGWAIAAGLPASSTAEVLLPFGFYGGTTQKCIVFPTLIVDVIGYNTGNVLIQTPNIFSSAVQSAYGYSDFACELSISKPRFSITKSTTAGSVICNPAKPESGETSTCYAIPDAGYTYGDWGGDCGSGTNRSSCTLANVTAVKSVSASFVLDRPVAQIVTDPTTPTTLYSALDGGGVWKKVGAGDWTAATTQPANLNVKDLVIAATGATLYAATDGGGVFKSTDSGVTWAVCPNTGLTNLNLRSLTLAGTTLYAGTTAGVFTSTDGCDNWTAMNSGLPN